MSCSAYHRAIEMEKKPQLTETECKDKSRSQYALHRHVPKCVFQTVSQTGVKARGKQTYVLQASRLCIGIYKDQQPPRETVRQQHAAPATTAPRLPPWTAATRSGPFPPSRVLGERERHVPFWKR